MGTVDRWLAVALVAGGVAATWVAGMLLGRIDGLSAPPYDLAFFQQIVWNVGHDGRWVSSFNDGSFLGLHLSPILVVPALLERLIWPDVRVLSLIHALAIGASIPAAFLFLRAGLRPSRFGPPLAFLLAASLPVWGAMQDVIRSDFHPEVVGVVLALLAGWLGLSGRPRAMWVVAVVALLTREDVAYAVVVVGLVIAARGGPAVRRHGRFLVAVAAVWAVVAFGILMPQIRAGVPSDTAAYYAWLGGGWGVLLAPFTKTAEVIAALSQPAPWLVFVGMLASLGGLPLLRPRWFALVLPPLIALLLSAHFWQANLRLQYPVILIVPLLAATLFGGRRALAIIARWRRRYPDAQVAARLGVVGLGLLVAIPAISGAWVQGSLTPFDGSDPAFRTTPEAVDGVTGLDRAIAIGRSVPESALLVADEGLVAPLAGRTAIRRLAAAAAGPPPEAYVLIDRDAWSPTYTIARLHDRIASALASGDRPLVADDGRFMLWGPEP